MIRKLRVIVCGAQNYTNEAHVREKLSDLCAASPGFQFVMTTGMMGVAWQAKRWAIDRFIQHQTAYANTEKFGAKAWRVRNTSMLSNAAPDMVIAFPGDQYSDDLVVKARAAGVEVIEVGDVQ